MAEGTDHQGSTPMFAIFVLSIYSLYLIPYTIYKLCGGPEPDSRVSKAWTTKDKEEKLVTRLIALLKHPLTIQWIVYLLLFWWTSASASAVQQFDPFLILQVPLTASDADIKKAYRRLSLQYHPDKNPDPSAADYFANFVSKAYQALTDEAARENYQKYGHPDGPQAFSVSVALPEWLFSKDKEAAPLILLALLAGGIVAPLAGAAWYLTRSTRRTPGNQVLSETLTIYAFDRRYGIKPVQGLPRIPETLVCAMEFIAMPDAPGQNAGLDALRRRVLVLHPDLRDKTDFWKRRPSVVKAHMLLLAHLAREPVPSVLAKDLDFVLKKCPGLLNEMFRIATTPPVPQGSYGWLTPMLGCLEMTQHLVQAVPLQARKQGKGGDAVAALQQLPGLTPEGVRHLAKKKIKTLQELWTLAAPQRESMLRDAGLEQDALDLAQTSLSAAPTLWLRVRLLDEMRQPLGPDVGVLPGEAVIVQLSMALTRGVHASPGFDPGALQGRASLAYAPLFPAPKEEVWYFVVGDALANAAMCVVPTTGLVQAERAGAEFVIAAAAAGRDGLAEDPLNTLCAAQAKPEATKSEAAKPSDGAAAGEEGDDKDSIPATSPTLEPAGAQEVSFVFRAPRKPGRHNLTLFAMCDAWIGVDRTLPLKLRVEEPTRAQVEARAAARAAAVAAAAAAEAAAAGEDGEGSWQQVGGSDAGSGSEAGEERSDEEAEHDYDSDEYGTEESSDEEGDNK